MSTEVSRIETVLIANTDQHDTALAKSEKKLDSFGANAKGDNIRAWASKISGSITNMMDSVIQPFADITRSAFDIGAAFDDSFDKIRIATGATGAAFEGLQESFRNVASGVPASFDDISTALAELSQRTNQTGADLEGMATTQLNLARLTGGDLSTQIQKTTRLFGDWSIATAGQVPALDSLLKASQATGVEVNSLASSVILRGASFHFSRIQKSHLRHRRRVLWRALSTGLRNSRGALLRSFQILQPA